MLQVFPFKNIELKWTWQFHTLCFTLTPKAKWREFTQERPNIQDSAFKAAKMNKELAPHVTHSFLVSA